MYWLFILDFGDNLFFGRISGKFWFGSGVFICVIFRDGRCLYGVEYVFFIEFVIFGESWLFVFEEDIDVLDINWL